MVQRVWKSHGLNPREIAAENSLNGMEVLGVVFNNSEMPPKDRFHEARGPGPRGVSR